MRGGDLGAQARWGGDVRTKGGKGVVQRALLSPDAGAKRITPPVIGRTPPRAQIWVGYPCLASEAWIMPVAFAS